MKEFHLSLHEIMREFKHKPLRKKHEGGAPVIHVSGRTCP